jgi:hypothetical protein
VIKRQGDQLVSVPYHEEYARFVLPAADLLDQAAELSQNESLTEYLKLRAEALRTDEYYDSDLVWIDLNSNLDMTFGPIETYIDHFTGQKTGYQANVMVVDRNASKTLDKFKHAVPELQKRLPVAKEYRPDQAGTLTPMEIVQDVYRTGNLRAGTIAVAFSLPNDRRVWAAKGTKKVIAKNFVLARRQTVLEPLGNVVLDNETARQSSAESYFNWLLMHEVSHTLGPRMVDQNGTNITVVQAMGEFYSPIEEGKADITGLNNLPYLLDQEIVTGSLGSHYAAYLTEALRSIRFGNASAYGLIRSAVWSYFVEKSALSLDSRSGQFHMDTDRMTLAIQDLTRELLIMEGQGDKEAAAAFIDKYARVSPDLKALLDKADKTVPVELVPRFPQWENEQGW